MEQSHFSYPRIGSDACWLETTHQIKSAGFPILDLQMSEFEKMDGGVSCLSIRF